MRNSGSNNGYGHTMSRHDLFHQIAPFVVAKTRRFPRPPIVSQSNPLRVFCHLLYHIANLDSIIRIVAQTNIGGLRLGTDENCNEGMECGWTRICLCRAKSWHKMADACESTNGRKWKLFDTPRQLKVAFYDCHKFATQMHIRSPIKQAQLCRVPPSEDVFDANSMEFWVGAGTAWHDAQHQLGVLSELHSIKEAGN